MTMSNTPPIGGKPRRRRRELPFSESKLNVFLRGSAFTGKRRADPRRVVVKLSSTLSKRLPKVPKVKKLALKVQKEQKLKKLLVRKIKKKAIKKKVKATKKKTKTKKHQLKKNNQKIIVKFYSSEHKKLCFYL